MKTNRQISRDEALILDLQSRIKLEMQLTDVEAQEKVTRQPQSLPADWHFDRYRNQSPWRKHLFDFLGTLVDKTILDLGCGYNPTPIYFALAGAKHVYACDVSPKALAYVQEMAHQAGVADRVSVILCPGEQLPLAGETIELIHCESTLHHLLLPLAGAELVRVLKEGGKAGFKDPLGQNPVLELARDYLPYHWKKSGKGTDRPLKFSDIENFGQNFAACTYQGFGFLSVIATYIWGRGKSKPRQITDTLDGLILRFFPFLQRFCRFVVTKAVK